MINRITIELPLLEQVGVSFFKRKPRFETVHVKTGFSFDNLAMLKFNEAHNIETPKQLDEWTKQHGQNVYLVEQLYYAHISYNMHNRINKDVPKAKFMIAIANIGDEKTKQLIECWKNSKEFGAKEVPGKKKAKGNR